MKKLIALLMTLALVISALALPALAEEADATADATASATAVTAKGGRGGMPGNGQQPPAMPGNGQNNQNDQQFPAMPGNDENSQNDQQFPAMPGYDQNSQNGPDDQNDQNCQNSQNGQKPSGKPGKGGNGRKNRNGQQPPAVNGSNPNGQPGMLLDFEQLVKDGVIDQELCDKILNYMKEHAPQGQPGGNAPAENSETPAQPDGNAPAEGSQPPAAPDGVQGQQGGFEEQLLKDLLDNSIITQEQYDLLLARIAIADTTAAAATETAETTESGT